MEWFSMIGSAGFWKGRKLGHHTFQLDGETIFIHTTWISAYIITWVGGDYISRNGKMNMGSTKSPLALLAQQIAIIRPLSKLVAKPTCFWSLVLTKNSRRFLHILNSTIIDKPVQVKNIHRLFINPSDLNLVKGRNLLTVVCSGFHTTDCVVRETRRCSV